jgi:hypothetical protein
MKWVEPQTQLCTREALQRIELYILERCLCRTHVLTHNSSKIHLAYLNYESEWHPYKQDYHNDLLKQFHKQRVRIVKYLKSWLNWRTSYVKLLTGSDDKAKTAILREIKGLSVLLFNLRKRSFWQDFTTRSTRTAIGCLGLIQIPTIGVNGKKIVKCIFRITDLGT